MGRIYFSNNNLLIRSMKIDDAKIIYDTYLSYGWHPSLETYENYYKEQEENKRKVFIAEYDGEVSGLCTLVINPTEGPWSGMGYPEIVDLTVFYHVHNKGIGNKLLDAVKGRQQKYLIQYIWRLVFIQGMVRHKEYMLSVVIFRMAVVFGIRESN